MPDQDFSVHVDPDELAKHAVAAALNRVHGSGDAAADTAAGAGHHGAQDDRQAARGRSERDHARQAAGAGKSRSYAFRRS